MGRQAWVQRGKGRQGNARNGRTDGKASHVCRAAPDDTVAHRPASCFRASRVPPVLRPRGPVPGMPMLQYGLPSNSGMQNNGGIHPPTAFPQRPFR